MQKINELHYSFLNRESVKTFKNWIEKLFNSEIYFFLLMIIALINWKFRIIYLELIFGLIIALLIFIMDINRIKTIPLVLFAIASLRLVEKSDYILPVIIGSSIVLPLLFLDLFRKKISINNNIFVGMILILIAMFFSIVNSPNLITPILGILMWFFYTLLFLYFFNIRGDVESNRIYIAKSFTYFGVLIFLEMMLFFLEFRDGSSALAFFTGKDINLGWGISTYIAMIFLIIIPLTCYLFTINQKKYQLLIVIFIELFALLLLLSRGAYLALIIISIPFSIKFLADIKNKTDFMKTLLLIINICLLLLLFVAIPTGLVKNFYNVLNERGLSLSGRGLLYRIGLNVFYRYPLFGGGVYTSEYYLSLASTSVYYHNFIIQTLATIGIVGAVAFGYYSFHLVKQTLLKVNYNTYVFYIVLGMLIHGFFDTTFYNPLVMVLFSLILPFLSQKNEIDNLGEVK